VCSCLAFSLLLPTANFFFLSGTTSGVSGERQLPSSDLARFKFRKREKKKKEAGCGCGCGCG
jgi:hypothetical protein